MPAALDDASLSEAQKKCALCGGLFPASNLKQASIPDWNSLCAASDLDLDSQPPEWCLDRKWYCSDCRWSVNLKRNVAAILFVGLMILLIAFGQWLRQIW